MSDPVLAEAATSLIQSFGSGIPANAHAVWVNTSVDEKSGEFVKKLHVAVNPAFAGKLAVPAVWRGIAVIAQPWGKLVAA